MGEAIAPFAGLADKYAQPDLTRDLGLWAHMRLGIDLWSLQKKIGNDQNKRVYVRSCHDSGKTLLAAVKACHWIDTHPQRQARVISTAPTNDQVVGLLWNEINQMFDRAASRGTPLPGRVTQQEWWIGNYQAGVGRKPSDYKGVNFQGYHALWPLVIVDEADAITADMWTALDTLMTNDNACLFSIGNPDDPTSYFRKLQNNAENLGYQVYVIRAEDTPNFTGEAVSAYVSGVLLGKNWVRERVGMWGGVFALDAFKASGNLFGHIDHPLWSSKVMAEYPDESNLTIIRSADVQICAATEQEIDPNTAIFGTRALGVDFAGSETGDETVVRERVGHRALRRWGIRSADPEVVADFVVSCAQDAGSTQIVYDATGVGFGFGATLRRSLPRVALIPFVFGAGAADKDTFLNARAELYWKGRELSRDHKWDLSRMENSDETIAQLVSIRRVSDSKKIQVESKGEIKHRIGRSPDDADALLMAFYAGIAGGEARISTAAGVQIPTGSASVTRSSSGMIPTGASGLTRGAL